MVYGEGIMKKFLFISNISNGITNFALPSILAAQKMGYEVHLAADYTNFSGNPDDYNVTLHQIDLHRFPLHPKNIKAYRQMIRLMKTEGFDTVHCNTPIGGLLGRVCSSKCSVRKVIYTAHGFHFYKGAPLVNTIIYKTIEKLLAKKTDALITINTEDFEAAKKLKLKKGGKVFYVPGVGIDTERFSFDGEDARKRLRSELNLSDDEIMMISVGELNQNKNNEVVIKALSQIHNDKIRYFLCGVGPLKDELGALAEQLNMSDRVEFLGYRQDIPALFKAADIFTLPSIREGLSRSIMEAMASSLACIVSRIRGNVDLIIENKGGYLPRPHSVEEFAEAISNLANDSELRKEMGEFNKTASLKFDSVNVRQEIEKIFAEVI